MEEPPKLPELWRLPEPSKEKDQRLVTNLTSQVDMGGELVLHLKMAFNSVKYHLPFWAKAIYEKIRHIHP